MPEFATTRNFSPERFYVRWSGHIAGTGKTDERILAGTREGLKREDFPPMIAPVNASIISIESPVGLLCIAERGGSIVRVSWSPEHHADSTPLLAEAACQLAAYFAGDLREFDLPLDPGGGDLEARVFDAMRAIPYGETRTYGDIARDLGTYGQPVGQACGANPIPVIIPCHRVLSATGLGGYSGQGGVETKIALLKLEGGYPLLL
jgi:methylated-DNA-[protein]-cysteine S-methyltransferase